MLRLTAGPPTQQGIALTAHGWLEGSNTVILAQELDRLESDGKRVILDLGGVRALDDDALQLLTSRCARGLELRGGSGFVRALLHGAGLSSREGGTP